LSVCIRGQWLGPVIDTHCKINPIERQSIRTDIRLAEAMAAEQPIRQHLAPNSRAYSEIIRPSDVRLRYANRTYAGL